MINVKQYDVTSALVKCGLSIHNGIPHARIYGGHNDYITLSVANEVVRDYLRVREYTRLDLVRTKQRLQKFLLQHGYVYESSRYWTGRHDKWLHVLDTLLPFFHYRASQKRAVLLVRVQ